MILDRINQPNDIKNLNNEEVEVLAGEIREFLIESLSNTGGHLASNLGCIELTMALHLFCDLPQDKIVWDVGHQSYTHKILTGRKDEFKYLRQAGHMSGFPKRAESDCDVFDTGHSSTSISAALGMVHARELDGDDYKVIAVIGDGSMTGGEAFEAINNAGMLDKNMIIVLNDNEMSISENVGGLSAHLGKLRTSESYIGLKEDVLSSLESKGGKGDKMIERIRRTKAGLKSIMIPGMVYEEMGVMYMGPIDGHNIQEMVRVFNEAARRGGPVIVHVKTKKGLGYGPAEKHPSRFHGTGPYELETGIPKSRSGPSYTDIFSTVMRKMGDRDPEVLAITAAMADGTGLKRFSNLFPERFFDVGIAEQHAVTFAAGLATCGKKPVVAIYSSFLQRAYDQILMDVCMQKLHVVFAIDRAGFVGADGCTHNGIFDLSYLGSMPNMTIMAPKNKWELSDMMKFAVNFDGPIAIRYPRGAAYEGFPKNRKKISLGKSEMLHEGSRVLLFAIGSMVEVAEETRELLVKQGLDATVVNARFAKPIDKTYLKKCLDYELIVTMEENVLSGGFGERVRDFLDECGYSNRILNIGIKDEFINHGTVAQQRETCGIDAKSIAKKIKRFKL